MANCPQHRPISVSISQGHVFSAKGWILSVPNPHCMLLPCFQGYQLIYCKSVSLPAQLSAVHKLLFRLGGVHDWNSVLRTPTEGSEGLGRKSLLKWWFISMEINNCNTPGKVGSTTAQQVTKHYVGRGSLKESRGGIGFKSWVKALPSGHRGSLARNCFLRVL